MPCKATCPMPMPHWKRALVQFAIHHRTTAVAASILDTPPYSPDPNPIEEAWATLQDVIRRLPSKNRQAFDAAVASAMDTVTPNDIQGWTDYAGYSR